MKRLQKQKNQFNTKPVFIKCKNCGTDFRISPRSLGKSFYCSRDCYTEAITGIPFANYKHGLANKVKAYGVWKGMRKRCNNQNEPAYPNYGGRGIKVCKRWNDFMKFYKDMGDPKIGYSLDRIDNNKGYFTSNCRWATRKEQAQNRRPKKYVVAR